MVDSNTLIIINIIITALMPLINSIQYLFTHVSRSSCCNGKSSIEFRKNSKDKIEPTDKV